MNNENIVNNNQVNTNKKNKKVIIIIVAVVIAVVIGLILFFALRGGKKSGEYASLSYVFDPNKPIVIEENNLYGYITSTGKTMIEPKYKKAGAFYGDYAVVSVENDSESSYRSSVYQIIDRKGNVIITSESYSAPKYYTDYEVWVIDGVLYDSKLNRIVDEAITVDYVSNGLFSFVDYAHEASGIIDSKGKVVFKWDGAVASIDISDNDNSEDDLYATVTVYKEKQVIVSLKTGKVLYTVEDAEKEYVYVSDDNIFSLRNRDDYSTLKYMYFKDGKLVYENSDLYDLDLEDYNKGILKLNYGSGYKDLGKTSRYAYYDINTKKESENKPSSSVSTSTSVDLTELTYGYKQFSCSSKDGLMSGENIVLPCEYDDIDFVNSSLYKYVQMSKKQDLVLLEKDDVTTLFNLKNKKELVSFDSTSVYDYSTSTFIKATIYGDGYTKKNIIIYNILSGKSMTFEADKDVSIYSNYIVVEEDDSDIYYNTNLEQIYVAKK